MSLASFFGLNKLDFKLVDPDSYALCLVHVQRKYCDPAYSDSATRETDRIAANIAGTIPAFRKAGMPVYFLYRRNHTEPPEQARGGFHRVRPETNDIIFGAPGESAFENTDLGTQMRAAGRKTLLVEGFEFACCVNATVQDARREGFNVWVLSDGVGHGGRPTRKLYADYTKLMLDSGAEIMTTREAIKRLQQPRCP